MAKKAITNASKIRNLSHGNPVFQAAQIEKQLPVSSLPTTS